MKMDSKELFITMEAYVMIFVGGLEAQYQKEHILTQVQELLMMLEILNYITVP